MLEVKNIEIESVPPDRRDRHSSYDPENYIPCIDNTPPNSNRRNTRENSIRRNTRENLSAEGGRDELIEFQCGECCRFLPCHYFDYVGGTSTGG